MVKINVDTVCATQAIHNARDKKRVSPETANRFYEILNRISFKGEVGRREFDYTTFLVEISTVTDIPKHQLQYIWEELGNWLSQAIGVSNYKG